MDAVGSGTMHEAAHPPEVFEAILGGSLRHDLRRVGDDVVRPGDLLHVVEEGADGRRTGRELTAEITYVTSAGNPCALSPDGLGPGHAILSLALVGAPPRSA